MPNWTAVGGQQQQQPVGGMAAGGAAGAQQQQQLPRSLPTNWGAPAAPPPPVIPYAQLSAEEEARRRIRKELEAQADTVVKIRTDTDPRLLEERVRLEEQITKAVKERELAKLRLSSPEALREQVRLDRELSEARRRQGLDRASEEGRQSPLSTLGGIGAQVAGKLPGGNLLGAGMNVFSAATGEGAAGASGALSGLGLGAAAGPLGAVIAAIPAAVDGLKTLAGTIEHLGAVTVEMGGKASPAALMRYQFHLDNLNATLGRVFVPALETMTDGVKLLGDFMATVLPTRAETEEIFRPVREAIAELRPALAEVAPPLRELGRDALQQLAFYAKLAVLNLKPLLELMKFDTPFSAYYGGNRPGEGLKAADVAPRQPQFQDVSSFLQQQYASALFQSTGQNTPEDRTATATETMVRQLTDIAIALREARPSALLTAGELLVGWNPRGGRNHSR